MEWFQGSIPEAISKAKTEGTLFVVAVHGSDSDDATKTFMTLLNQPKVSEALKNAVAIKLESGSESCQQFSAIYPVIIVPSLYFINSQTGVDLEVTGGSDLDEAKVMASIEKVREHIKASDSNSAPGADLVTSPRGQRVEQASNVLEAAVGSSSASQSQPESQEKSQQKLSMDERVARARQLLADRQREREEDQEDKVKNSEIERRESGKKVAEMKRQQEDQKLKEAAMERRKDKEEEKAARERVRAQIAQDREERSQRFNEQKETENEALKEKERERLLAEAKRIEAEAADRATVARIQFRLPDGRNRTQQFPSEEPVSRLYSFVSQDMDSPFTSFSLSTTFPTRSLDAMDASMTLKSAGLAPSATVLILPKGSGGGSVGGDGGFMSLLFLLFTPLTMIWGFISSFINPPPRLGHEGSSNAGGRGGQRDQQQGGRPKGTHTVRRDGNIARLGNISDDDDNNTWNGNSTQQQ